MQNRDCKNRQKSPWPSQAFCLWLQIVGKQLAELTISPILLIDKDVRRPIGFVIKYTSCLKLSHKTC